MKRLTDGGLSEQEFEALPPTLRRKYFSSLERLRLAQYGAFPPLPSSRKDRMLNRDSLDHRRPSLSLQRKISYLTRSSSRRVLRKAKSVKSQYLASQADALWFSSLPQKIQQRQFTREEQVLFAGNRDTVILDAADEALYRMGHQPNTSVPSLRTDTTFQSEPHNNGQDPTTEPPKDSASNMDNSFYDSFRWLEEEDDLDLTLADYHDAVTETARPTTPRRSAFRRTLSLTSLVPNRPSMSLKSHHSSHSIAAGPLTSNIVSRPLSTLLTHHKQQASTSSIEPSAQHYQDPEARAKLRVYLASPQKFDEAVEFGFPSLDAASPVQPGPPAGAPRKTQETERSFLDDAASLSQGEGNDRDEDMSLADSESPQTPQDTTFQPTRTSKQNSVDRPGILRPHILRNSPDPYIQSPAGGREMTLHMTLTRPDLRTVTPDIRSTALATGEDPLKLSDLPLIDERHPAWDSVPEDGSKMKKLWKKLTSR